MQAGLAFCETPQGLTGHVEGDGHSLRKIYVSNAKNQEHWMPELENARQKWHKAHPDRSYPKYWLAHVRIAGLKQRNGHAVVVLLPIVLQPPGSAPKPEAYDEVHESQLFKHVGLGRGLRTQVHSDGAPCWPKIVKGMKKNSVRSFHVKHNKMEFVKKVKKGAGHILTGTQCIDRFWQSVDSYIPSSVQSKRDMTVNPRLLMYLYSYIWRSQLPKKANFAKHLGKIC